MSAATRGPVVHKIDDRLFQIDTLMFGRPRFASVYLVSGKRAAILDAGVSVTVDTVLEGVAAAGVRFEEVAYVCITHAHYDHAGGAHELLRRLTGAGADVKVVCAEKPSIYLRRQDILDKIMASGRDTEGDRAGVMKPIDAKDILVTHPGDVLDLGGNSIQALDAPGHANGHLVFLVPRNDFVFVGDACGVCGRTADPRPVIAPTAFAPEYRHRAYIDNVRAISGSGVKKVGIAHFGVLANPRQALLESIATADWIYGLVHDVVNGRRGHDEVMALMDERLQESLLPLYQSRERMLITIKSMVSGMLHDLQRPASRPT